MIEIKQNNSAIEGAAIVFIIGKSTKKKQEFAGLSTEIIKAFQGDADKKFDFFKLPTGFVFLVDENQNAEDLRIAGSKIFDYINKENETQYQFRFPLLIDLSTNIMIIFYL